MISSRSLVLLFIWYYSTDRQMPLLAALLLQLTKHSARAAHRHTVVLLKLATPCSEKKTTKHY